MKLDIERVSAWQYAVERWALGDARPLADFVLRYGVRDPHEREAVARMLTSKPDPRRAVKPATQTMLRDLRRALAQREYLTAEFAPHLRAWVLRLRRRLAARGLSAAGIDALLQRRRPGYLRPPRITLDALDAEIARRHGVTPDAIKKLRQRRR
jgi:hypothetical protein